MVRPFYWRRRQKRVLLNDFIVVNVSILPEARRPALAKHSLSLSHLSHSRLVDVVQKLSHPPLHLDPHCILHHSPLYPLRIILIRGRDGNGTQLTITLAIKLFSEPLSVCWPITKVPE